MKKLGILGGMGPESTLLYYKEIVDQFQKRDPQHQLPELTIETVNMYKMLGLCMAGDYKELTEYLNEGIQHLEAAGAELIVMASNTPHVVFQELQSAANVPMLSIVEPTYQAIKEQGYTRIAWLGTKFTMEQPFFQEIFKQNGITIITPDAEDRQYIDNVIAKELEYGIINQESKQNINHIIDQLIHEQQIQAIILGCTELPLMYQGDVLPIPTYNTLQYHIQAILSQMLPLPH